jgi:hypothetical protein
MFRKAAVAAPAEVPFPLLATVSAAAVVAGSAAAVGLHFLNEPYKVYD